MRRGRFPERERGCAIGVFRLVKIIGQRARVPFPVHFHMLRHSCGYKLANDGIDTRAIQDWLGHVSITHTTRYGIEPSRSLKKALVTGL
jgi:integrase